ncbi:MAG: hypothetical protein AB1664_18230 [Thermodesulfobacteriota bacterium]
MTAAMTIEQIAVHSGIPVWRVWHLWFNGCAPVHHWDDQDRPVWDPVDPAEWVRIAAATEPVDCQPGIRHQDGAAA